MRHSCCEEAEHLLTYCLDTNVTVGPEKQGWCLSVFFEKLRFAKLVNIKFCPYCGERLTTEDEGIIRMLYERRKVLLATGKLAEAGLVDQVLKALWHEEVSSV